MATHTSNPRRRTAERIVKRYTNHVGRQFARVEFADGMVIDVCTRNDRAALPHLSGAQEIKRAAREQCVALHERMAAR